MKLFQGEIMQSYDTYSFGYCNYLLREKSDCLAHIYAAGYLPYSGSQDVQDIFYMARSLRVALAGWELNSENKRILKRFQGIVGQLVPITQFQYKDKKFLQFCVNYFTQRHGLNIMTEKRIIYLLENFVTHILEYRHKEKVIAYVFLIQDNRSCHFAYSFYDLAYVQQSLGLWLMIDTTLRTQKHGGKYIYLGTAYGKKGLYKTSFNKLEYWNGKQWSDNIRYLKKRCQTDNERTSKLFDEWKSETLESFFHDHKE